MRHKTVFCALCALALVASAHGATYSGTLSYDGQSPPAPPTSADSLWVQGPSTQWPTYDVSVSWTVTDTDASHPGFPWKYTYTFEHNGSQGALSHVIIEGSQGISIANIAGLTGAALDSAGLQTVASGNEGMPEDMYGLRFNPLSDSLTSMTWTFWSNRQPVWGDVYGRCGNKQNLGVNSAYNFNDTGGVTRGFLDPNNNDSLRDDTDPTAPAADNSLDFHILVPDSVVPEPGSILLLAAGWLLARRTRIA